MDLNQLKTLNDAAVATFEELSQRQRYRKDTNLRRFRKVLAEKHGNIDLHQLEDVFKQMEALGLGSLVIGRDNKPTRFVWRFNLKDVAKAVETGIMPEKTLSGVKIKKPAGQVGAKPSISFKPSLSTNSVEILVLDGSAVNRYRVGRNDAEVVKKFLESLNRVDGNG